MEHRIEVRVGAEPESVSSALADLTTYPEWNDLVAAAEPAPAADGDPGPAYWMTLRARLGPFARSKQLRMIRTHSTADLVRFERLELDGREHASWIMEAATQPAAGGGSNVELMLRYDGGLWTAALEGVLASSIDRATTRLPAFLDHH